MKRRRVARGGGVRIFSFLGIVLILLFSLPLWGEEAKETPGIEEALITVNFQEADIGDVLRLISAHAQINIVADPEVVGEVTLQLRDVSWERALDMILRMHGWASVREKNIVRVTTTGRFKEEMKAAAEEMKRVPLETRTFFPDFALASEMRESIEEALSERGSVSINEPANALVVTDIPARLASLEKLIGKLGAQPVQIAIEAKLVSIILGVGEELGIDWRIVGGITRGAARPITFPFEADRGRGDFIPAPGDFPPPLAADFAFGVLSAELFRAVLFLLETQMEAQILSAPTITTLSNREARIHTGVKYPIPIFEFEAEIGWRVVGHEFIDIGVILTVTPRAGPEGKIIMKVKPVVSEIYKMLPLAPGFAVPVVRTKEAETKVVVRDGETLVIGGLIETREEKTVRRVPFLGDIPILGRLFRKEIRDDIRTELLIFITPRLVKEQKLSDYQKVRLGQIEASRRLREGKRMAEGHYRAGKRSFLRRDYQSAVRELKKALDLDPGHREAGISLRRAERRRAQEKN